MGTELLGQPENAGEQPPMDKNSISFNRGGGGEITPRFMLREQGQPNGRCWPLGFVIPYC